MLRMTERDMLRFESIFDLLIRLEFQEDQKNERMVAPGGKQSVSFAEIGGRTVAEFVRWGLHNGLLISCQREKRQLGLLESRSLKKPQLHLEHLLYDETASGLPRLSESSSETTRLPQPKP